MQRGNVINAEERAALHRTFLLRVSPHIGHLIAERIGGYTSPSTDGAQHELRDTLLLWFKLHATGGLPMVKDTAWWMSRLQDQYGRLTKEETDQKVDELASYAVATIGILIDKGVLAFAKEAEVPTILLSHEAPDSDGTQEAITKALLERLEASFKEDTDEQ